MEYILIIITIVIVVIAIIGGLFVRSYEKKRWNNGICKETGSPWKWFDNDSQGGRGYNSGSHYLWVSYKVDKISS